MIRLIAAFLVLFTVEGCYTTMVRVETEPPGATVHYDYQPMGVTPVEFRVDWYGKHKLTLDHPEWGRRIEYIDLNAPPHLQFPVDFFTALMPFQVTDRHEYKFNLTQPVSGKINFAGSESHEDGRNEP